MMFQTLFKNSGCLSQYHYPQGAKKLVFQLVENAIFQLNQLPNQDQKQGASLAFTPVAQLIP